MNGLLDTHTFLWWNTDDPQLSVVARQFIGDTGNKIYLSVACAWEIIIKAQAGKLPLPIPADAYVPSRLTVNAFENLPITLEHVLNVYTLPLHHKDPFDRILIAQSQVEQMPILTADPVITAYGVPVVW